MIELFPHNIPTYDELKRNLETHDKVALLQATGTGKSYIIAKYIEDNHINALILVPSIAIQMQWEEVTSSDIATYASMTKHYEYLKDYDLIVADEFHHLGSEVWGEVFTSELLNNGSKIIGASATEIRYLDNSRNMAEELFNNNVVHGLDLEEAIKKGVLPAFTYVSVVYGASWDDYKRKLERFKSNTKAEMLLHKLSMTEKNLESVESAVSKHLKGKNHKIIIFMNRTDVLEKEYEVLSDLFNADKAFKVTHKMSQKNIRATLDIFNAEIEGRVVLFAINILNEGVHVDGVDCVVFLRNTKSPQVYFQQLGRVLSVKGAKKPLVFDFVCNSSSIRSIYKDDKDVIHKIINNVNKGHPKEKIILFDYTKELNDLFEEINSAIGGAQFTEEEILFIKTHSDMNITELSKALNRSMSSIYLLATKAGVNLKRHHQKTDDETRQYILSLKGKKTYKEIADELGMSYGTVCTILSPASKGKRKEYKNKSLLNDRKLSNQECSKKLGCSLSFVTNYRIKNGIHPIAKNKVQVAAVDEDGNIVKEYDSIREASKAVGGNASNISKAIERGNKSKGFYWIKSK